MHPAYPEYGIIILLHWLPKSQKPTQLCFPLEYQPQLTDVHQLNDVDA